MFLFLLPEECLKEAEHWKNWELRALPTPFCPWPQCDSSKCDKENITGHLWLCKEQLEGGNA